jgi:hypothetical protein
MYSDSVRVMGVIWLSDLLAMDGCLPRGVILTMRPLSAATSLIASSQHPPLVHCPKKSAAPDGFNRRAQARSALHRR